VYDKANKEHKAGKKAILKCLRMKLHYGSFMEFPKD